MQDDQAGAASSQLVPMIFGYVASQMISTATRVGVIDAIGDGTETAESLAAATGTDQTALRRLLRALAAFGLIIETEDHRFQLTPTSRYLRKDVENSLHSLALIPSDKAIWSAWGATTDTIISGSTGFDRVHGMGLFDYLAKNADTADVFHRTMQTTSRTYAPGIASDFDFTRFKRIVDVGGGNGTLLTEILRANEGPHGTVFDLELGIAEAPAVIESAGVADRCTTESGSFFEKVPEDADCYVLKNTLNDWNDERCITILRNCRRAMTADGSVLIIASIMPEVSGSPDSIVPTMADFEMLVTSGGAERTAQEYKNLLTASDLDIAGVTPLPSYPGFSLIEARPA